MILTSLMRMALRSVLGGGIFWIPFILPSAAQVQFSKTVSHDEAIKVKIERREIVYVKGSTVVLKMEDGTLKEVDDVSYGMSFIVDGKPVNIHNTKAGMKLEKQTIAATTPKVVTTVENVTGKVWRVSCPSKVILTLENGQNQELTIPKGQKFMIDGQETYGWGLKKGMRVTAQRATEVPETLVTQEVKRTGIAPLPPPPPKQDVPILVVAIHPTPVPMVQIAAAEPTKPAEPTSKKLPKTVIYLALVGLLGVLFCVVSLMPMAMRMIAERFVP